MIFESISTGMLGSNCYIIGYNNEGLIIDAGARIQYIKPILEKHNLSIKYIILTHGHIDHICELDELYRYTSAKVLIHEEDSICLTNSRLNLSSFVDTDYTFKGNYSTVKGGEKINVGGHIFNIIHTPGHTNGCICVKMDDFIFSGDTLFKESIGRTDLLDGDAEKIRESIITKLFSLPDNVQVFPGHGQSTTIGYEKFNNPYVKNK